MKCKFCDDPATVHLTEVVNRKKRELHLCERCARRNNLIPDQATPHVDLKALLGLLAGPLGAHPPGGADPVALTCPACGLQYGEFRAEGRLGCPADYDAFRAVLGPLLLRIHRAEAHAGKAPRAARHTAHDADLRGLRAALAAAAAAEEYEEAARLRDLLRQKEASDEPR